MGLVKSWKPAAVACALLTIPLAACDSQGASASASASAPVLQTEIVEKIQGHFASTQPPKKRFVLGRLEYAAGEHALPDAARPVIAEVGAILAAHPDSIVRGESFATESGTDADQHLAARRAHQVEKALMEAGVARLRVFSSASGTVTPADARALGPAENGRTDLIVYTKKGFETAS